MEEVLNILYEFLFATPEGVNMGIAPLVAGALVSGVGKVIGGLFVGYIMNQLKKLLG